MKLRLVERGTACICTILALTWSIESSAAPVLDQSSESGVALGTLGNPDNAQTFTVGLQGRLSEIQVQVQLNSPPLNDLVLDVRGTSAGAPLEDDVNVLALTTLSAGDFSYGVPTWASFDVSSYGIDVGVGDILAIVLRSPTATANANWFWIGSDGGNPYSSGQRWIREAGEIWDGTSFAYATSDMNFRSFVEPVPIPSALWLFGSGLLGLIGLARRKAA